MKTKHKKDIEKNFISYVNKEKIRILCCHPNTLYHLGLLFYYYIYHYSKIDKYREMKDIIFGNNYIFSHITFEDKFYIYDIKTNSPFPFSLPKMIIRRCKSLVSKEEGELSLYWLS